MNSNKRIKMPRAVVTAGLLAALAVPTAASAMQPRADGATAVRHENGPGPAAYVSDAFAGGLASPTALKPHTVPAAYVSDAFAGGLVNPTPQTPDTPSSSPSSITHQIRTVIHDGSRTLPIVLAAIALGIALCGTGFAVVRVTLIQRRALGGNS
jgi:hypothetical protein